VSAIASPDSLLAPIVSHLDLVHVACPICGGAGEPALRKNGMTVERCGRCGFLFVNPRPTRGSLAWMYNEGEGAIAVAITEADPHGTANARQDERRREAWYRIARIRQFRARGRLLDIGCGSGETLEAASAAFDVLGVDLSRAGVAGAAARAPGRVLAGSAEALPVRDASVDVAVLTEVLEHAFNPMAALREAARALRPHGLLVVQTGDVGSFRPRLSLEGWTYLQPPVHLNFFSRHTLRAALRDAGARVLMTTSFGRAPWMALDGLPFLAPYLRQKAEAFRPVLDVAAGAGFLSQLMIAEMS
jgi:SAM-dependent methyltransferase